MYDGVTSPLQNITRAMDIVINSFENMQRTSGNAIDVEAIQQAREELARAETAFDSIENSIKNAADKQKTFNSNIQSGTSAAGGLLGKVKGIAASLATMSGLKSAFHLSDDLTSTKARLSLIVDDGGTVDELQREIMASAQASRALYLDTAGAIASMGANAKNAFSGNDELIAFMEQVNKQFVIGGASTQGQSAAMTQLSQAMAAGALRGEELNSILENAPGIARAIESYMGIDEGLIKSYAQEGLVTAEIVKNALLSCADETNAKFETMPKTWAQIWTSMQNKALSVFAPILNRLNQIANSARFQTVMNGIMDGLAAVAQIATWAIDIMVNGASLIVDNWSWISPILAAVVAGLLIYNTVSMITAAVNAIHALSEKKKAAAEMMASGATFAETAAQLGLNTALMACPITWIILGIIALIAIIYAVVAAINHFTGTTYSATGMIIGAVSFVFAAIANILMSVWNLIIDVISNVWDFIAVFVNFFANVFTDPINSICRAFFGMVDVILGILQTLASAIDTIFGSNLGAAIQGWRDSLGGWVDKTFGEGTEVMGSLDTSGIRGKHIGYGNAWDWGYNLGEGIEDKVSGLFDFHAMDSLGAGNTNDAYDFTSALDGVYNNTADTAANTAAAADTLEYTEEDLQYLKDIAEREAINRFTTAEIHIEQTNHNNITKDVDVDGIMEAWTNDFAERLHSSGEGVYA